MVIVMNKLNKIVAATIIGSLFVTSTAFAVEPATKLTVSTSESKFSAFDGVPSYKVDKEELDKVSGENYVILGLALVLTSTVALGTSYCWLSHRCGR